MVKIDGQGHAPGDWRDALLQFAFHRGQPLMHLTLGLRVDEGPLTEIVLYLADPPAVLATEDRTLPLCPASHFTLASPGTWSPFSWESIQRRNALTGMRGLCPTRTTGKSPRRRTR